MTHNKANKSKVLMLVLGLTMCLALMLGIVFASPTFAAYAEGGTGATGELIIDGTGNITAPDGTYAYSATDKTLMLNGYNGGVIRFTADNDVTVNLVNGSANTITLTGSAVTENQYGVYAAGNLTVTGKGTLNINMDISGAGDEITTEYGKALYGLYAKSLTINGEINVNVNLISNGFSCGMFAANDITIAEKANVDIKCRSKYKNTDFSFPDKVVYGIYSENGDIKLSGTGTKNIEHTCPVNSAQPQEAKGVYAQNDRQKGGGRIEISGAKLTIKMPNEGAGINSYYDCVIKNADVSIVDAEQGIAVSTATPSATTFKGVRIEKSKIYISTLGFPTDLAADYIAGIKIYNAELSIFDSDVYIESRSCISGTSEPTNLVFIKGASVVRLINPNKNDRYVLNAYVSTIDLSKGGSVTINSVCYKFYGIYDIKLGAGTKAEYGTKDSQSTNDSDAYYYGAEFNDDLKIIRFVYGEGAGTATTSAVKVEGMKGYAIEESEFTVTLAGDAFTEIAQNTDVTSWFKNMPSGLVAKIKTKVEAGATSLTVAIGGTPQSVETVRAYIEIPEQYLVTGEYDVTIDPNKNKVDFSIVSGEAIDVPVPSVTQFDYDGEAKVLLTDGEGYTVSNNKNFNAGEYTAVVTLKKGYKWADGTTEPINIPWTIKRQDVTIDVTLAKTTYECTGYTIEPEYTVYRITPTGNVELTRSEYKGELTDNKDVGTATLVVKDNGIGNYNITNPVTVNFEIVKGTKTPPTGLTGIAPSADGAKDGKITGTTADMEYSADTAFTSPKPCGDGETTGLAEGTYYVRYKETSTSAASDYAEVKVVLNSVTVVGGTGGGKYAVGASVTVKATVPTGKKFASWSFRGVVLNTAQLTQQEITFTMPDNDVVLTALFEDIIYNITVTNGTSSAPTAKYQEEITVTADDPATGKEFDKWVVSGITLTNEDLAKSTVTFKMPANGVIMEATYKDVVYQVTVTNGTATPETAKYQAEVTVTANAPATDMYFDKWEVTGITLSDEDLAKSTLTFQMPAGNVTFNATYLTIEKFEIVVVDGTKDKSPAKAGETITITANPAKPGKVFDKWTCETAGVTIEFASATSSKTTFVMPACEITIQAHFRDIEAAPSIEIKVEGGTGGGTYKQGDEVTVTAEDKEGKVFKGWQDESGAIVSTNKSYTFKVTGATTLTAVYEDKPSGGGEITPPAKKDGLSGGAIAGIVIGSVAVAGIGGFAIFWFAVKKKTFADLGALLKKGFTAIGNFFKNLGAKIKALFTKKN